MVWAFQPSPAESTSLVDLLPSPGHCLHHVYDTSSSGGVLSIIYPSAATVLGDGEIKTSLSTVSFRPVPALKRAQNFGWLTWFNAELSQKSGHLSGHRDSMRWASGRLYLTLHCQKDSFIKTGSYEVSLLMFLYLTTLSPPEGLLH